MARDYMKPRRRIFRKQKRLNRSMAGNVTLFIFMGICAVFMAIPLVMVVNNAFKPLDELFRYPPTLFVRHPSTDNFNDLMVLMSNSWVPFARYILNTVIITGGGTLGHVLVASLAAYPLAKHNFPGKKLLFNMVVLSSCLLIGLPRYQIILLSPCSILIIPTWRDSSCLAYGLGLY